MKVQVIDMKGKSAGEIEVNDFIFGAERNEFLIHSVATAQANNKRQGTKSALTMSEVRGHKKKPYRQKGTGNARQGTTKGPQFTGGGVAFAPKPRDFSTKINKREKMAAFISAISAKLADGELKIVKEIKFKEPKTREVAEMIDALKLTDKKVKLATAEIDKELVRLSNNIPSASVSPITQLSVLDLVTNKAIVATVDAIRALECSFGVCDCETDEKVEIKEVKATAPKATTEKKETTEKKPATKKTTGGTK
jgi:large subunit ribosomal protein L4